MCPAGEGDGFVAVGLVEAACALGVWGVRVAELDGVGVGVVVVAVGVFDAEDFAEIVDCAATHEAVAANLVLLTHCWYRLAKSWM